MRIKNTALFMAISLWAPTAWSDTTSYEEQTNARLEEAMQIQRDHTEERMSMYKAISPLNEDTTVSIDTRKQCLEIWAQRLPYGYKAFGDTYEVRTASKIAKLTINGKLNVITGKEIPFKFICALTDELSIDRFRTYFSIRFDEQARKMGHKGGAFGNPYLRRITDEEENKYGSRKPG